MEGGLREQKKLRTREAIVAAALKLFDERGYEQTTIADIAAAADIAPRTFFGYFPSKEAVVFPGFEEELAGFRAFMAAREPGVNAIDALHSWIEQMIEREDLDEKRERKRHELVDANADLAACERSNMARFGEVLQEAVAQDLGEPEDSLRARMITASALAALDSLKTYFAGVDIDDPLAVLDEALTFIRGGIAELQAKQPPELN